MAKKTKVYELEFFNDEDIETYSFGFFSTKKKAKKYKQKMTKKKKHLEQLYIVKHKVR